MREARDSSTWRTGELSLATVTAGTSGVTEADGMTGLAVGTVSVTLTGAVWGMTRREKSVEEVKREGAPKQFYFLT